MNITPRAAEPASVEERPIEERRERALEIVESISVADFPHTIDHKWRRLLFKSVTRQLKALGGCPEDYLPAIAVLCRRLGPKSKYETVEEYFMGQWPKVKIVPGRDLIAWAKERAIERPIDIRPGVEGVTKTRRMVLGMCYHLAHEVAPLPFIIPRDRLAEVLDIDRGNITSIVEWMYENKFIDPLDKDGCPTTLKKQFFIPHKRYARYQIKGRNAPEYCPTPGGEDSEW